MVQSTMDRGTNDHFYGASDLCDSTKYHNRGTTQSDNNFEKRI